MEYILSIDAGTTAFKTSLFDENGRLLGISTREYELLTPDPLAVVESAMKICEEVELKM